MFESGWFAGIGWGLALFFLWAQIRSLDKQQQAKAQLLATQAQLDEARQATWQLERQLSRLRFQLEDREDELTAAAACLTSERVELPAACAVPPVPSRLSPGFSVLALTILAVTGDRGIRRGLGRPEHPC